MAVYTRPQQLARLDARRGPIHVGDRGQLRIRVHEAGQPITLATVRGGIFVHLQSPSGRHKVIPGATVASGPDIGQVVAYFGSDIFDEPGHWLAQVEYVYPGHRWRTEAQPLAVARPLG